MTTEAARSNRAPELARLTYSFSVPANADSGWSRTFTFGTTSAGFTGLTCSYPHGQISLSYFLPEIWDPWTDMGLDMEELEEERKAKSHERFLRRNVIFANRNLISL